MTKRTTTISFNNLKLAVDFIAISQAPYGRTHASDKIWFYERPLTDVENKVLSKYTRSVDYTINIK